MINNKISFFKAMLITQPYGNAFSGITQSSFFVKYTFMKRRDKKNCEHSQTTHKNLMEKRSFLSYTFESFLLTVF